MAPDLYFLIKAIAFSGVDPNLIIAIATSTGALLILRIVMKSYLPRPARQWIAILLPLALGIYPNPDSAVAREAALISWD